MTIKKIGLSWVTTADFDKSLSFFTETLGLDAHEVNDAFGWMELMGKDGNPRLGVGKANDQDGVAPGSNAVVTFTVEDIVAAKEELVAKGVNCIGEIEEIPNIVKMQFFKDLDGNLMQLVQELAGNK